MSDIFDIPTLDKMLQIQKQSQLCGEFLEWLQSKYSMFDKRVSRESPFVNVMGTGDYINTEKLLAEFFGINLEEAEREREELLNRIPKEYYYSNIKLAE